MAMGLTVFLLTMVTQVFSLASQTFLGSSTRVEMHQEARAILAMMSREIAAATPVFGFDESNFTTDADKASKPFWGVAAVKGHGDNDSLQADGIAFVSEFPGQGLKIVAYRLDFVDGSPKKDRPRLIRYEGFVDRNMLYDGFDNDGDGTADEATEYDNEYDKFVLNMNLNNGGPFKLPLSHGSTVTTALLDNNGDVNNNLVDKSPTGTTPEVPSWSTLSENVVSLSFRYYRDFDYDGAINEDETSTPPDDADDDGTKDEDPPAVGTPADYWTQTLTEWTGYVNTGTVPAAPYAGWQGYAYWVPALVEIRLVIKSSKSDFISSSETFRVFHKLIQIPSYDRIKD